MIKELVYVISTILTYVLGKISKKYHWNENLPIPVQNVLVGLIVFGIAVLYQKATSTPIDIRAIIDQIVLAFGGSGTATLIYDTKKTNEEYR